MKKSLTQLLTAVLLLSAMNGLAQSIAPGSPLSLNPDTANIKKKIWGTSFFAPLNNHLAVNYEQAFAPQISFSGEAGIIGLGITGNESDAYGLYLKAGPKLYVSPDYMMDGMYRYNNMQGGYFKPELILTYFSANSGSENIADGKTGYMAFALMLSYGKQWVFANSVAVDVHAGMGYGAGGKEDGNQYSHAGGNEASPFAASFGISIGFLTK